METVDNSYIRLNKEILLKFRTRRRCISLRLHGSNFMQLEFAPVKNIQRTKSPNF